MSLAAELRALGESADRWSEGPALEALVTVLVVGNFALTHRDTIIAALEAQEKNDAR